MDSAVNLQQGSYHTCHRTVYRPPGGSISQLNDSLDAVLSAVKCSRSKIFLAGDFNTNVLNHDSHCETDAFLNLMYSNKCFPVITCPTRFSSSGYTLINDMFTSCLEDNYQSGVLMNDISDHLPVFYYVAHYVWPYHETVRMSVCLSVTCHISKTEPDRAIVTIDHYIEVGCN